MGKIKYKSEEELVAMMERREIGWLDYVNHHSPEWQIAYTGFCRERDKPIDDCSAREFVAQQDALLERIDIRADLV